MPILAAHLTLAVTKDPNADLTMNSTDYAFLQGGTALGHDKGRGVCQGWCPPGCVQLG